MTFYKKYPKTNKIKSTLTRNLPVQHHLQFHIPQTLHSSRVHFHNFVTYKTLDTLENEIRDN